MQHSFLECLVLTYVTYSLNNSTYESIVTVSKILLPTVKSEKGNQLWTSNIYSIYIQEVRPLGHLYAKQNMYSRLQIVSGR